ncbi:collagen alpha-1(I) chain-like [Eumetopias jubatus]|uniref:collagen alpha-1(I) chain-like n=1 Tax=Eumetopias jubatus TaxID=34886 RepID=UPI001016917B|nr:collagen alpha-1(I) chain-like [Eumetopias jubatus]
MLMQHSREVHSSLTRNSEGFRTGLSRREGQVSEAAPLLPDSRHSPGAAAAGAVLVPDTAHTLSWSASPPPGLGQLRDLVPQLWVQGTPAAWLSPVGSRLRPPASSPEAPSRDCLLNAGRPEAAAAVSSPVHPVTHTAAGARPAVGTPTAASTPRDTGTRTASVAGPLGLLLHGPETPSEPLAPSGGPAAPAAVGTSVTGLCPHTPEASPEPASATIGPEAPTATGRPAAVGISAVRLPPNKPEGPLGPSLSPVGAGIRAVLGTPNLVGARASAGPRAVSLSPHRPATPPGTDSSGTDLSVLGATGTPPAVDIPAVCLLPGKPEKPPEPASNLRRPGTLAAVGTSGAPDALALAQALQEPRQPVSFPMIRGKLQSQCPHAQTTAPRGPRGPLQPRALPPRRPEAPPEPAASPTGRGDLHSSPVLLGLLVSQRYSHSQPYTPQAWSSPRAYLLLITATYLCDRLSDQRPRHLHWLAPVPHTLSGPTAHLSLHSLGPPHGSRHPQSLSSPQQPEAALIACTFSHSSRMLSCPVEPGRPFRSQPRELGESAPSSSPPVPVTHTDPTGPTTWGCPTAPSTHTAPGSPAASTGPAAPGVPEAPGSLAPAAPASALLPRGRRRSRSRFAPTQRVSQAAVGGRRPAPRPRGVPAAQLFPHGRPRPRPGRLGPTQRPAAPLMAAGPRAPSPPAAEAAAHTHARTPRSGRRGPTPARPPAPDPPGAPRPPQARECRGRPRLRNPPSPGPSPPGLGRGAATGKREGDRLGRASGRSPGRHSNGRGAAREPWGLPSRLGVPGLRGGGLGSQRTRGRGRQGRSSTVRAAPAGRAGRSGRRKAARTRWGRPRLP